uniref:Uncharacterized protein n=1 Tax=Quercus lobata TaxID=97700 RepID=A0A7N2M0C5_QUELO
MDVRASTSPFSPNIADTLGDVNIFTAAGDPVFFKDLWDQNQGIAVVALLRHFGCPCSWELASALKEAKPKFDAAGVKLVAIGVGTPDKARILADRWGRAEAGFEPHTLAPQRVPGPMGYGLNL